LFLLSAFSSYKDFLDADANYENLLLGWNADLKKNFQALRALAPGLATSFLEWSVVPMYSYSGRTQEIPRMLSKVLDLFKQNKIEEARARLAVENSVMGAMSRAISCQEIFQPPPDDGKFHLLGRQFQSCREFDGYFDYFDYTDDLKNISAQTFLWSGRFDHVTPRPAMDKMALRIPHHFYYRDPDLGHLPDKIECVSQMFEAFFTGAPDRELRAIAGSQACINPALIAPAHQKSRSRTSANWK
jgi:pimeloyl-ACP methyl ester carboxylesterase